MKKTIKIIVFALFYFALEQNLFAMEAGVIITADDLGQLDEQTVLNAYYSNPDNLTSVDLGQIGPDGVIRVTTGVFSVSNNPLDPNSDDNYIKFFENRIGELDPDTLIIFDIDEVLTTYKDNFEKAPLELIGNFFEQFSNDKWDTFLRKRKLSLVSDRIPEFINYLKQNYNVIALTNTRFSNEIPVTQIKIENMKKLGIEFHCFCFYPEIDLNDYLINKYLSVFSEKFENKEKLVPFYRDGILFATHYFDKGLVLKDFLDFFHKNHGYRPSRIVFFDNSLGNIYSVKKIADQLQIPFLGIHAQYSLYKQDFNEELFRFQTGYFLVNDVWLNDQEALRFVK